jgi:hypothetical protein
LEVSGRALRQSLVGPDPAAGLADPGPVAEDDGFADDSNGVSSADDSGMRTRSCAVAGSIATRLNREADPAVLRKFRRRYRFGISSAGRIRESCGGFVFIHAA